MRDAVPETAPLVVLKVHDEDTALAPKLASLLSVAETLATVEDAQVGPAVPVATPVVSRPAMLAWATLTGELPG